VQFLTIKKLARDHESKMEQTEAQRDGKLPSYASNSCCPSRPLMRRRIMLDRETQPEATNFSQTVDVDLDLGDGETKSLPNMPGYLIRSASEAILYTKSLLNEGISSVTYRLGGGLRTATNKHSYIYTPLLINNSSSEVLLDNTDTLIARHSHFYRTLRAEFPRESLFIIGDPFGLAPNLSDGAWGVRNSNETLDLEATNRLLSTIAVEYAQSGVDAILNIGRIEGEVETSRKALRAAGLNADLYAFSQNNESKAAYVYLDKAIPDSFQKILPGNITEMKVRTILDIVEGASSIIIKPADNFHVIQFTINFLRSPHLALSFLSDTLRSNFYRSRPDIREKVENILSNKDILIANSKTVRVGTYTVSGSYYIDKLVERDKGIDFRFNLQDERFRNILSIIGKRGTFIIDRSSQWYLRKLNSFRSLDS